MHVWFGKLVGKNSTMSRASFESSCENSKILFSLGNAERSLSLQKVVQPFEVLKNLAALTRACL